jgi:putative membrane protein (TIGR04086 family)
MNIRWMAVLTGYLVDLLISILLPAFLATPEFFVSPDLSQPADLVLMCLLVLSTGVGGYVAGRMAQMQRVMHGLLVGVVGILINQLLMFSGPSIPRVFVIANALGCLAGALGGLASRYIPQRQTG